MNSNFINPKSDQVKLRQKAEELFQNKRSEKVSQLSEAEILKLIHELEVHQIELEMINEELSLYKEKEEGLTTSKYIELYDCAPIGYCTLSREGRIIEINLSGASLLGKERSLLFCENIISTETINIHFLNVIYSQLHKA